MTNTQNLKAGTKVSYDGRSNGVQTGTILKREVIKSYYSNGDDTVYYAMAPVGLMIPAADILEVL